MCAVLSLSQTSSFVYAVGTVPPIRTLHELTPSPNQLWYADNASVTGELPHIRQWFDNLLLHGPKFGYLPEPHKICLVVKESMIAQGKDQFSDQGIKITTSHRFLKGDPSGCHTFLNHS